MVHDRIRDRNAGMALIIRGIALELRTSSLHSSLPRSEQVLDGRRSFFDSFDSFDIPSCAPGSHRWMLLRT